MVYVFLLESQVGKKLRVLRIFVAMVTVGKVNHNEQSAPTKG